MDSQPLTRCLFTGVGSVALDALCGGYKLHYSRRDAPVMAAVNDGTHLALDREGHARSSTQLPARGLYWTRPAAATGGEGQNKHEWN